MKLKQCLPFFERKFMKKLFLILAVSILAGCATPYIDRTYTAVSQDSRAQFLILHYTAGNFESSLKTLTQGPVSSHYLVNQDPPTIYQLVDETRRAYHAGVSYWKGATQLNASSIGIEIVNLGYRDTPEGRTYFDFPQPQIDAVIALVKKIVKEHSIKPERILAHSDIAPGRKPDPGPRFPWKQFADAGLIIWPDATAVAQRKIGFEQQLPDIVWWQRTLAQHGYAVPQTGAPSGAQSSEPNGGQNGESNGVKRIEMDPATTSVIASFQMKYRPANFDGKPDAETAAILDVLTSPTVATK